MIKKIALFLLGLLIVLPILGGLGIIKIGQFKFMGEAMSAMQMPPEVVTVAEARTEVWQPRISTIGSVAAIQGTIVSTEAEGVVRQINFEAGASVKAGDLLLQLDKDVEEAQLRATEASAELALTTFRRAKELLESRNISREEFDTAAGTLKEATAQVDNLKAVIAKKQVRAPFDGQLGIREISVGQFLQKGAAVVSLQALDPVYVDFSLPQQDLGQLKTGLTVHVRLDAFPDETFEGKVTAINPDVDSVTRNVRVQATVPNKDHRLRPGMFVSADIISDQKTDVLIIPETAVQYAPYGNIVYVVEPAKEQPEKTADKDTTETLVLRQSIVRLGHRMGDFITVNEGLKPGDPVVSTGVFKYSAGTTVTIDNTLAPPFKLNPNPDNT